MQLSSLRQTPRARPDCARTNLVNTRCLHAVHSSFSCGSRLTKPTQYGRKTKVICRSARRLDVQAVSALSVPPGKFCLHAVVVQRAAAQVSVLLL